MVFIATTLLVDFVIMLAFNALHPFGYHGTFWQVALAVFLLQFVGRMFSGGGKS